MAQIWIRAEERDHEARVACTPVGVAALIAAGHSVTVEDTPARAIGIDGYRAAGAEIAAAGSWRKAPRDVIVLGLKELPMDGNPLIHKHIMFGHAYKGQPAGHELLKLFKAGGGTLLDLEYLTDEAGRRVAAFGYWAGYAGAAVAAKCWAAQQRGTIAGPVGRYNSADAMLADIAADLGQAPRPSALVIGALGRVGTGASDLCEALGISVTKWDMAQTAHGGPFPEILEHELFFNCILAQPGCPVFVPHSTLSLPRKLSVIGDIACDPTSAYSPIKVYDDVTSWDAPALRVANDPVLDVTAIDNLPSLLPVEASEDYAAQLLPTLLQLDNLTGGVWGRAAAVFAQHVAKV